MKLLLENWRKYLVERKLSADGTPVFLPFRTDIDIYNNKTAEEYGVSSPSDLNELFAKEGIYGSGPLGWLNNDEGNNNLYDMMVDSNATAMIDREALKNSTCLWIAIWGYVGFNQQPQTDDEIDFIRQCYSSGVEGLSFYEGTAYRGMGVSQEWLFQQLFGQEGAEDDEYFKGYRADKRQPEDLKMGIKDYLNFYRLMKGQKVITPQTNTGYWTHYPRGEDRVESWSRSEKVAVEYARTGAFLQTSEAKPGNYLSIVMVAETKDNEGAFLNFDLFYKSTIASAEKRNQEVPAFVKRSNGIKIKKAIIPYNQVKKIFKDMATGRHGEKLATAVKSGQMKPMKFENKQNQKLLKEGRYSELYEIEQDWEIIF